MTEGHTERLEAALDGKYLIERELGEGGMATVYLADDLKHERKVALKVLKPELVGAERCLAACLLALSRIACDVIGWMLRFRQMPSGRRGLAVQINDGPSKGAYRMKSVQRTWGLVPMLVGVLLAVATPADAQRSGFVIGLGLGPGHYSLSGGGTSVGKTGLGVDFHIGGTVGTGVEIYFFEKLVVSGSDSPGVDTQGTGVAGVGVAFPVSPKFDVHGGVGTGVWAESTSASSGSTTVSATAVETNGLGLVAGGRYKLNESGRWMLNFDILHAAEPFLGLDVSVTAFQLTINIMSH